MTNPSTPEKPETPPTEATPLFDTVASETGQVDPVRPEDTAPPASAREHVSATQPSTPEEGAPDDAPTPPPLVEPQLSPPLVSSSAPTVTEETGADSRITHAPSPEHASRPEAVEQSLPEPALSHETVPAPSAPAPPPWGATPHSGPAGQPTIPGAQPDAAYPTAGLTPPAPHTVYVTAPTPPKRKGNRLAGVLYALLATVVFCALFIGVAAIVLYQQYPADIARFLPEFLSTLAFLVPSILFLVGFAILALLANRAGWWAYVLGSFLVAAFVYFGTIGVVLFSRDVIAMTPREAAEAFSIVAVNQWVIIATIIAREVSIWFGAPIARRGRRMTEHNAESLAAFERERGGTVGAAYPAQS